MGDADVVYRVLQIGAAVLVILSFITLRKGREIARRYKRYGKPMQQKEAKLPHRFTEESVMQAARKYARKRGHVLAFDTDILLEHPYLLSNIAKVSKINMLISQQVRYELDKWKDSDSELNQKARVVLKQIANLHKEGRVELVRFDKAYTAQVGLRPEVKDDIIISSYMEKAEHGMGVVFVSNDNNARTTARTTDLIALELDWNSNKRGASSPVVRPGYTYKLISVICFSLVVGFISGAVYLDTDVRAGASSGSKEDAGFSEDKPTYVDGEFNYLVRDQYNQVYEGKKAGDWGGVALIDRHTYSTGGMSLVFAGWSDNIKDKHNQLMYRMVLANGVEKEQDRGSYDEYRPDSGISMASIDTNITFEGVNYSERAMFYLTADEIEQLEGATIQIVHKVKGDIITEMPLDVRVIEPAEETEASE
ncbi:PIN domain-containing protein [Alteribacillus iranensis]|uniref:PIN domain-containing protein n=1 Tax=Alteribacillus iranensis TaxID=930128 RepID=A0A1I2BSE5_9BACI|nr:PIN domain-containing protein [Alteribacillus iranensis]SFE59019.1 PIN domain-containing protein [Alteribacillus iranensis]